MKISSADFFQCHDYVEILNREYCARKARRRDYSLVAFARDLGISVDTLRGVLKYRYGLSSQRAEKLAEKLRLTSKQKLFFVELVESRHARSQAAKLASLERLKSLKTKLNFEIENNAPITLLDRWYYPAILKLLSTKNKISRSTDLAKSLQISVAQAESALSSLVEMGVVRKSGDRYQPSIEHAFFDRPSGSDTVRNFHKQLLSRSQIAIDVQNKEWRKNLSAVLAVDSERINEARDWLQNVFQEFSKEFSNAKNPDRVYSIGIHFNALDLGTEQ